MGLQEWDSFALKNYSFAVRKTNSFFSVPTLFLSLLIIAVSILLNLKTISHLWIPMQQLNVDSTLALEVPQALTSTFLCIKPLSAANVGKFRFFRADTTQLIFPRVSENQVAVSSPQLYNQIGKGFECADLQGFTFKYTDDLVYITVQDTAAQMFIKGSSFQQIFNGKYQPAIQISDKSTSLYPSLYYFTYIKFSISDSLFIGAQPKIINTARSTSQSTYIKKAPAYKGTAKPLFSLGLYSPLQYYLTQSYNYNTVKYSVTRNNIAYIIGAILSWVSLLMLILGFIAAPLMDLMLSLLTAESLFYLEPEAQKPSFWKFCIASLKSGIFKKEDRLVRMCEKVEKMKDVGVIVKLQMLLARLFPNSQHLVTEQQIATEHSFDQVTDYQSAIQLYKSQQKAAGSELQLQEDEQDVSLLTSLRKKVLYFFDTGSDNISVRYSKGGIGSECSFLVTTVISLGFICFLFLFGVFALETTKTQLIVKLSDVSYTAYDSQLVLTINSNTPPKIYLMDGTFKKLSSLTLKAGQDCINTIPASKLTNILGLQPNPQLVKFFCFPSFPLRTSMDPSLNRLLAVDMSQIPFTQIMTIYQVSKVQSTLFKSIQLVCLKTYGYQYNLDTYNVIKTKLTKINEDGNLVTVSQFLPKTDQKSNIFVNGMRGSIIELIPEVSNIDVNKGSIFDVVQSVWSFTIIVFTIVVVKLTKYINLKEKQKVLTAQRAQFRDSICVVLSRIDGLLKGRQSKELENLKFYTKEKMIIE